MKTFIEPPRIIKVDGEENYFLAHWVSDNGIIVEVSDPRSVELNEHVVTEYDGSELKL